MNPHGLDHILHAVRDLDAACDFYARLGFSMSGLNQHPWGTHNRQFRLPGFGGEIITLAEPEKMGEGGFSEHFARYHQSFLARREGLSLILLTSTALARDAAQLKKDGIGASDIMTQLWDLDAPDGGTIRRGFSLAFARDPLSPEASFALCQQENPDPTQPPVEMLRHANGASAIAGAVLVADNPTDHHIFMSQVSGVRDIHSTSRGLVFKTPRGDIEILTPVAFRAAYGVEWGGIGEGAVIAAMRIAVADLDGARRVMEAGGCAPQVHQGKLVIGPEQAFGATLVFEEERRH